MAPPPAIVHLIGHPAVGKYTVAKALVGAAEAAGAHFVLMDNHATGNVILPLLDLGGGQPVPNEVWDRVGEVREVVYRTITDMSPPDWTYVFTNVLVEDDPGDRAVVGRMAQLAEASGRRYVPVRLRCEPTVQLQRVVSPERGPRHKWTDVTAVDRFIRAHDLVEVEGLDLDTTSHSPEQSAAAILAHLDARDVTP